jgi:CheY-like chemotaxis protein
LGFAPTTVSSGPEALAHLRAAADPDGCCAVLLDVMMPGMDGFAVARAMQADSALAKIPVIMLSSADQDAHRRDAGVRVSHYLVKPVARGALFRAILDAVHPGSGALAGEDRAPIVSATHALDVLLVEDGQVNRLVATAFLERQGHRVQTAEDGLQAVAAAAARRFDVILMDVMMPNMDGLEATGKIREAERSDGTHTPIIAMTAFAMVGDRERCLAAGMDAYLTKPITSQRLATALAEVTRATVGC